VAEMVKPLADPRASCSRPDGRSRSGVYVEPQRLPGSPDLTPTDTQSNVAQLLPVGSISPHGHLKPKFSNTRAGPAAYVRDPHASVTGHGCSRVTSRGRCTSSWALSGPEGTVRTTVSRRSPQRLIKISGQSVPSYAPARVGSVGTVDLSVQFSRCVQMQRRRRSFSHRP